VRLDVLDAAGRCVGVLVDEYRPPGQHEIFWKGCDRAGRALPAGVYILRARAHGPPLVRKLCLTR
jgi:hypothetical protein